MAYIPNSGPWNAVGDAEQETLYDKVTSPTAKTLAAMALIYHGYKRTGSLGWALLYGVAGRLFPVEAVPIAIGQGYAEPKKVCP